MCPSNQRNTGNLNPPYTGTFVFDNDFAALLPPEAGQAEVPGSGLFTAEPEHGLSRVVCFSPRHDLTLPLMSQVEVEAVIQAWMEQTLDLGSREVVVARDGERRDAGDTTCAIDLAADPVGGHDALDPTQELTEELRRVGARHAPPFNGIVEQLLRA